MADDPVSKNGVFIDTKTGKVVEKQPEEGIQLVPAGGTLDAAANELIEAAKNAAAGADSPPEVVDLSVTEPSARSTKAK